MSRTARRRQAWDQPDRSQHRLPQQSGARPPPDYLAVPGWASAGRSRRCWRRCQGGRGDRPGVRAARRAGGARRALGCVDLREDPLGVRVVRGQVVQKGVARAGRAPGRRGPGAYTQCSGSGVHEAGQEVQKVQHGETWKCGSSMAQAGGPWQRALEGWRTQIGRVLGGNPSGLAKPGSRSSCCGGALCVAAAL